MKRNEHIQEAHRIGADSWGLINFMSLLPDASPEEQVDALKRDRTSRRIDDLIRKIEDGRRDG